MGILIKTDGSSVVLAITPAMYEFNYEAFNATQNALFEKEERYARKSDETLAKRQRQVAELKAEYARLKEAALKIQSDRRLKKSTRTERLEFIIEAMMDIEDKLVV